MNAFPRWARVLVGAFGIFVGIASLWTVFAERRAANERQRVLAILAEDFRRRDPALQAPVADGSAVVWEGRAFRRGDRVRIAKWSGTFKPEETGAAGEVQADEGHVGVVIGGEERKSTDRMAPNEPIQIVRVRWLPQKWKESDRDHWLDLPQFEATIHVSYLEVIR